MARAKECICTPDDWVGRVSSHANSREAEGPMHSEWVCSLHSHRDKAEAAVRKLGFDPIFTPRREASDG